MTVGPLFLSVVGAFGAGPQLTVQLPAGYVYTPDVEAPRVDRYQRRLPASRGGAVAEVALARRVDSAAFDCTGRTAIPAPDGRSACVTERGARREVLVRSRDDVAWIVTFTAPDRDWHLFRSDWTEIRRTLRWVDVEPATGPVVPPDRAGLRPPSLVGSWRLGDCKTVLRFESDGRFIWGKVRGRWRRTAPGALLLTAENDEAVRYRIEWSDDDHAELSGSDLDWPVVLRRSTR